MSTRKRAPKQTQPRIVVKSGFLEVTIEAKYYLENGAFVPSEIAECIEQALDALRCAGDADVIRQRVISDDYEESKP